MFRVLECSNRSTDRICTSSARFVSSRPCEVVSSNARTSAVRRCVRMKLAGQDGTHGKVGGAGKIVVVERMFGSLMCLGGVDLGTCVSTRKEQ